MQASETECSQCQVALSVWHQGHAFKQQAMGSRAALPWLPALREGVCLRHVCVVVLPITTLHSSAIQQRLNCTHQ